MSDSTVSTSCIQLPLLYFESRGSPLRAGNDENDSVVDLPAEVLHQCLTSFATWGDLAKLSAVQRNWSKIMYDAANQSPEAKWELAEALLQGSHGLEANPVRAMQLFRELSEGDNEFVAQAMKKIAQLYLDGYETENDNTACKNESIIQKDVKSGLSWMERSHLAGDAEAAHDLALIYEYGHYNVEIDVVEAFEWFGKAAHAGHTEAMAELGLCYELGCGVEQSDEEALDWYMKAAEKGHNTAKYSIGEAFEEARGVPQSDEEACLWYYKAAIEGCEDSRNALRRLEDIARIVVPGARALLDSR